MNLKRKLRQTAVYWPPAGVGNDGSTLLGTPVELSPATGTGVRIEDCISNMLDSNGDKWTSKTVIFSSVPLLRLGVIWEGTLEDANLDNPLNNPGASAIRETDKVPDRKATSALYESYL